MIFTFIKSKINKDQKRIVLFHTGNYRYEIWDQAATKTVRNLTDMTCEGALLLFDGL